MKISIGVAPGLAITIACIAASFVTGHIGWIVSAIVLVVIGAVLEMMDV